MPTNDHPSPSDQKRPRGRTFAKGNGGRKLGARNRASLLADALLEGEEEELVRKGIELAKAGDPQMLKFFLDRILSKERPVKINLPQLEVVAISPPPMPPSCRRWEREKLLRVKAAQSQRC